jgi:tetratricopeptide (TPR) repeat protein
MNLRSARVRAGFACLTLVLPCRATSRSTTLVRATTKTTPELGPVQTYAGKVDAVVSSVKPAGSITVLLLTDSLSSAEMDSVKKDLLALYVSLRGHPLRLAVLRGGAIGVAGPFASRAHLKSALSEVAGKGDSPASAASPASLTSAEALLDHLCASAGQLGADWSRVLLVGELPPLEASEREYASSLLLRAFGTAHVQVSWYAFSGGNDGWLPLFQATGGTVIRGSLSNFSEAVNGVSQFYFQVDWTPPAPNSGFVLSRSVLSDLQGHVLLENPDVAASPSVVLPSIERYATMRAKAREAAQLLAQEAVTDANAQSIRDDLQTALEINPRDPDSLLTAAAFYEKMGDYASAARERAALTEVQPSDAASFAGLGHSLVLASDFDAAEAPLERAIDLNLRTPQMVEDLARIRLAHKDDKAALPYLAEALTGDPHRQDLWFVQAEAAERLKDSSLAIHSFEQGLASGGAHPLEGASLARLYLATNQKTKASQLAEQLAATLPQDPNVRVQFAASLDELQLTSEALSAWRRVLEVQSNSGRAHLRIAQLLLDRGDTTGAEQAANMGLATVPKSAPLYVVKADALEKAGRLYEARKALEEGAANVRDVGLVTRLAATEDTYAGLAADAYAQLAATLEPASPERAKAIERGLAVSVRDADLKHIQSFTSLLEASGHHPLPSQNEAQAQNKSGAWIPGGLDALAFSAHSKEGVPPGKFLVEYCRALIERVPEQVPTTGKRYVDTILAHFQRVTALEALGKQDGNRVLVTLSLTDKDDRRRTEKALGLLGMKLHISKGTLELDRGEKKDQAERQETVSALAIDEVGLQEALKAGKPYSLEITNEWVPVYPNEKVWRDAFYPNESDLAGIATAMLRLPKMARLYVGFSYLDRKVASELLSAVNLTTLEQRYADLVYAYSAALAIEGGRAVVPGGPNAEAIWARLAGASPAQPGTFFRSLLEQNNGKLLAFFFALSQLDRQHQEFFTANQSRTSQFYRFFVESEEARRKVSALAYDSAFVPFLRSVPLDSAGHVDFPGSAEVWMVAKGHSSGGTQVAKMMKKVSKAVAPEVEDDLLLRLAQTRYKDSMIHRSELENFLAVARIDLHRAKPLDEASALLLAQNYADFAPAFPYLTEITGLGYSDYLQFFAAVERVGTHPVLEANLQLGQFHSLIEWICLLRRRHAIDDNEAAKLFKFVCDQFDAADSPAAYTTASLESARAILGYCKSTEKTISADETIRSCLLGSHVSPESRRSIAFQRTLDLQKVPSLEAMFAIYDRLARIKTQGGAELDLIKKNIETLPLAELPKGTKVESKEKESIVRYEATPVQKSLAELAQKLSKKKPNAKDVEKISQELLGALQPQVTLALAGQVYAYFLRPSDLVVSEDPLLLRKHHYFDFDTELGRKELLTESRFNRTSQGAGSYFVGGFARFALAAGEAASVGWKTGGPAGKESIAAEIAAIRSAAWDRLDESDQRLASLRITVAREWIYVSASQAEAFRPLSEDTMGVLSLSRRADLLNGIEMRDWRKVWESVTLPDLFLLGGKYLERFKTDLWTSPVTVALRSIATVNDGSRLNILGPIPYHSLGCNHPHLVADAPYEEYELRMFPQELAERSAEFKLFLAFEADNLGLEPSALSDIAETLASRAFRSVQMTDAKDWRSLLAGFASIMPKDIKQALEQ